MKAERNSWIKIGEEQKRQKLQDAVQDIERKWPKRFDFRITPDAAQNTELTGSYRLFLKHR